MSTLVTNNAETFLSPDALAAQAAALYGPPTPPSRLSVLLTWLARNPLVSSAVGLMLGIAFDSSCRLPFPLLVMVFVGAGLLVCVSRRPLLRHYGLGHLGLALAALAVGASLHDLAMRRWPADHVVRLCSDDPVAVRIAGTIISPPLIQSATASSGPWFPQLPRTRFILAAQAVRTVDGSMPVSGLVSVSVREPALAIAAGDRVEVTGDLRRCGSALNPGGMDWALVNRRDRILVQMFCKRSDHVRVMQPEASLWHARLNGLRRWARAAMLEDTFSGDVPGCGFLAAMVLGQRSEIDPAINDAFVRSGTVHYLSVSGAHVGMMVMAIWMLGWLLGLSRRQCAGAAMFAATAYAILAEPSPPIFRAAIMTDLGCLSLLTGRPTRVANWLAMSALVILVVRPTQLFNAGFQLSYVTLLSVIYVAPALHDAAAVTWRRLRRRDDPLLSPEIQKRIGMTPKWPRLRRCLRGLGWYMAIGLAAWTVGGLLSAYHFHQLQMWGWLNTMLLVPLVWIVMVLGLVKTLVTPFVPWLAGGLGWPLAVCTQALIGFVQILSSMPGSGLPTPALPTGVVCLSLLVVLVWVVRVPLRLNIHAVRFAVLCSMIAIAWSAAPRQPGKELRVVVLAVGSGSSIVLELPNGKTLLYDVGSFPPYDLERWTIGPLLARDHCPRIDAVILSHANLDHYGGLGNLLARRSVGSIISTPHFEHAAQDHHASRELVKTIQDKRIPWRRTSAGARLSGTGDVLMEVLWPPPGELQPADSNDTSLVLRVSHEGVRILLCGDIEEYAISQLIAGVDVQADILLLPHHGSVVPSTAAFIRAVNPKCCIRSTGRKETSEELRKSIGDRDYLSTAQGGAVSIGVAEGNISIERP